jgi:hypothetical protein
MGADRTCKWLRSDPLIPELVGDLQDLHVPSPDPRPYVRRNQDYRLLKLDERGSFA